MKKLFLTIALTLTTLISYSQFNLAVYQDIKLATMTDDYGNEPFTTDVLIKATYVDGRNISMAIGYEYADLKTSYHRSSISVGYSLNLWNININPQIEAGSIWHNGFSLMAYGGSLNVSYPIYKNLSIASNSEIILREFGSWRLSNRVGLKFNFK